MGQPNRGALLVLIGIGVAIGIAAGVALALLAVQVFGATGVGKARRGPRQLIEDAEREGEAVPPEAQIGAREQAAQRGAQNDAGAAHRREWGVEKRGGGPAG